MEPCLSTLSVNKAVSLFLCTNWFIIRLSNVTMGCCNALLFGTIMQLISSQLSNLLTCCHYLYFPSLITTTTSLMLVLTSSSPTSDVEPSRADQKQLMHQEQQQLMRCLKMTDRALCFYPPLGKDIVYWMYPNEESCKLT